MEEKAECRPVSSEPQTPGEIGNDKDVAFVKKHDEVEICDKNGISPSEEKARDIALETKIAASDACNIAVKNIVLEKSVLATDDHEDRNSNLGIMILM